MNKKNNSILNKFKLNNFGKKKKSENNLKKSSQKFKKKIVFSKKFLALALVKIFLISLLLYGYFYINQNFENELNLLAVNENTKGEIAGGSLIPLKLSVKKGSGQIYINLNHIEEVDTQISIINSQKISCDIFNLDCENYDFYYSFDTDSILLKGPSASSAIAIIVAKTLNKEKIKKDNVVITGALGVGGLIENVGGVEEKVKVASDLGFKKVLIPYFSKVDVDKLKNETNIEIIKVLDIVDAYNNFNGDKFEVKKARLNDSDYKKEMKNLALLLCNRTKNLENEVKIIAKNNNIDIETINSSNHNNIYTFLKKAKSNKNYSNVAFNNKSYYSAASFCFSANINYQIILELLNNKTENLNQLNFKLNLFQRDINREYDFYNSKDFKKTITNINDFYAYLIILDRIYEAKEYIEKAINIKYVPNKNINLSNNTKNISSINIITNSTNRNNSSNNNLNENSFNNNLDNEIIVHNLTKAINEKKIYYAYAKERMFTIDLWRLLIKHQGEKINFNDYKISSICNDISKQAYIYNELLLNYNINIFDQDIKKQQKLNSNPVDKYLCVYNGLELIGKINAVFLSFSLDMKNKTKAMKEIEKLYDFTTYRLSLHSKGNFPLIPYMYHEYSKDLLKQSDIYSSVLYTNYALAFIDLNTYLLDNTLKKSYLNIVLEKLYSNEIFLFSSLLIIAFI